MYLTWYFVTLIYTCMIHTTSYIHTCVQNIYIEYTQTSHTLNQSIFLPTLSHFKPVNFFTDVIRPTFLSNFLPTLSETSQFFYRRYQTDILSALRPSMPIHPSVHPSVHPPTHPQRTVQRTPSVHVHPSIHPSIHPFIHPSMHPSINQSVRRSRPTLSVTFFSADVLNYFFGPRPLVKFFRPTFSCCFFRSTCSRVSLTLTLLQRLVQPTV